MSSSTAGKHAGSGAARPAAAEPTFAERARTLVYLGRVGSFSTLSRKQQGFPFGSVMPYGLDGHRNPIFLISTMAMHTQNLKADPRSSLLVTHSAVGIVQHMNADHGDALILLAQAFAGIEAQEAVMTSVDRLGFHGRLKTQEGMRGARIAFLREVSSPAEARDVLVDMTAQARRM